MLFSFIPSVLALFTPSTSTEPVDLGQWAHASAYSVVDFAADTYQLETDRLAEIYAAEENERLSKIFLQDLQICYRGAHQNVPKTDGKLNITNFKPMLEINEHVTLATAPVDAGCLFSGFGMRALNHRVRLHKGWDIAFNKAVDVYAAGTGHIIEAHYRYDYGNMILIDHGHSVFTRYAHLDDFQNGLKVGAYVAAGQPIGTMGTTAKQAVGRHLHYEILTGDYHTTWKSFGLKPVDIWSPQTAIKYEVKSPKRDKDEPTHFFFTVKANKKRA